MLRTNIFVYHLISSLKQLFVNSNLMILWMIITKLCINSLLRSCWHQIAIRQPGCKHYVHGSFIAYLEKYVKNPLVINSFLIGNNEQILIQVQEKNEAPMIGVQSSICIQHMVRKDCCCHDKVLSDWERKYYHWQNNFVRCLHLIWYASWFWWSNACFGDACRLLQS